MFGFDIFIVAAILLCFLYNMFVFAYSGKILLKAKRKLIVYAIPSALNTLILFLSDLPLWQVFLLLIPILLLEFMFFSKSEPRQLLCGASMFTINISMVFYLTMSLSSSIFNLTPSEILSVPKYTSRLICASMILLIILLLLINKFTDRKMIARISAAPQYSEMLTVIALLFTFAIIADTYIIVYYSGFPHQITYSILSILGMTGIVYFVLLYSIKMLNLHKYKRFADQLDETYNEILEQKKNLANTIDKDELTGLFNRKFIQELLESVFGAKTENIAVLFVDINGLKFVNDNFGHVTGDKLIICIAKSLARALREDDIAARIGGDEFLVILNNITTSKLDVVISRLKSEIEMYDELEDFPVSASIGGLCIDDEYRHQGISVVMAEADAIMRKNKAEFYESRESRYLK